MLLFTWDPVKNTLNQSKHGVSFEEALTVFYDEFALVEYDETHSYEEYRFRILGRTTEGKLLLVVHCYHSDENEIRIISARKATNYETGRFVSEIWRCQ